MYYDISKACWYSHAILLIFGLLFLWFSIFHFVQLNTTKDPLLKLLSHENQHASVASAYALILCCMALFGYVTITEKTIHLMMIEIAFTILFVFLQLYTIRLLIRFQYQDIKKIGNYMHSGLILFHKAAKMGALEIDPPTEKLENASRILYKNRQKCCGIFSWRDVHNFKPKECCPSGYIGTPGKGQCSPLIGHHPDGCLNARLPTLDYSLNKFTIIMFAMICIELNGIGITSMALYMALYKQDNSSFYAWSFIKLILIEEIKSYI